MAAQLAADAQAPAAPAYSCSLCRRQFARAEHLTRHERTHTKEKPYKCERCPESFARRDLLKRHEGKAHGYTRGLRQRRQPRGTAQQASPKSAKDMSEASSNVVMDVSPADTSIGHPTDVDLDALSFTQWLDPGPTWDFGIESSGWAMNLLCNQTTATAAYMDPLNTFQNTSIINLPSRSGTEGDNEPPFASNAGASNPSDVAQPQVAVRRSTQESPSGALRNWDGRVFITEDHWNSMDARLSKLPLGDWSLPSAVKLNQYIARFLTCFHRHQPLFHESTWVPSESPDAVILAVCANGAQYCLEGWAARRLFQAAVPLAAHLPSESMGVSSLQADMLLVAFAAWSGRSEDLDIAMQFHGKMALDVRQAWSNVFPLPNPTTWIDWVKRETLKRTTYCCFTVLNLMTVAYDIPSCLQVDDIHGLPAPNIQWDAQDSDSWNEAMTQTEPQQWHTVRSVVEQLAADGVPPPIKIGPFACHIVISTLCQAIMLFHKVHRGLKTEAFAHGRRSVAHSLNRWHIMWESEPNAVWAVSPDNPYGPMAFNCTAILRIAHIRLAADHAPVRNAFSVRAQSEARIATAITTLLQPMPRDAYDCRAAFQACLALRVPIQLGFAVISRTGFWSWSVQHALSYFECAVFLGRWLLSIQTTAAENLTSEEREIFTLVEQIIEGSPAGANAEGANFKESHPRAILRLFIGLLDTSDVTVWALSPRMSKVLETWLEQLYQGNGPS